MAVTVEKISGYGTASFASTSKTELEKGRTWSVDHSNNLYVYDKDFRVVYTAASGHWSEVYPS